MMFTFSLIVLLWYAQKQTIIGLSLAALFVSLTRPEGILASLITFILVVGFSKNRKKDLQVFGLWFLCPLLIYFILRWWYFGLLLPPPIIVKVLNSSFSWWGPRIFLNFLTYIFPFLLVIYLNKWFAKSRLRLFLLGPLSYLMFYPLSNHWMN